MTIRMIRQPFAPKPTDTSTLVTPTGIQVGYETWGVGPPLMLIHGAFSDQRTNWRHVKPLLAPHVTGIAMSRRGRGQTDKTIGHDLADEIADAVALIRHIGHPLDMLGHSYGALVALGAAREVPQLVRKLVLYEAPWPHIFSANKIAPLVRLGEAGDWQCLAMTFFADILGVPQAELHAAQGTGEWAGVIADTPASLADLHALSRHRIDPHAYRVLGMPVLLQTGSESPPELYVTDALASVLPAATVGVLPGQAHDGMSTAPAQYAASLLDFLAT